MEKTLHIGIDKARAGHDESCLTLMVDSQIHIIPDPWAGELIKHLSDLERKLEVAEKCLKSVQQQIDDTLYGDMLNDYIKQTLTLISLDNQPEE